jgi:hypothetical protein
MTMYKNREYTGGDFDIVVSFLRGEKIQFQRSKNHFPEWKDIPEYSGNPIDIFRVRNPNFSFRLKPETTTANIHVHADMRDNTVWATADQSPCADNIKVTFDEHGTPIKAEII